VSLWYVPLLAPSNLIGSAERSKPLYEVPTLRDYFMDLDYLLGVIADGPTKSFAFRRLKYLSNKWSMYSLLYEYEEIADMKVCGTHAQEKR
jgi:AMP deaminase